MLKFNHTAHKEMWNWLAENPEMDKDDWPGWEWRGGKYYEQYSLCFACDCCGSRCDLCPLAWPNNAPCYVRGQLFNLWYDNFVSEEERAYLARQIANLPVRKGVETE